ncbi:MAG: NAD-dependent epimerase [Spirochaetaceae bacterium]|nr:MAG: NAD-dependent epimerase [Spirochaetaceae bacterium]
MKHDGLTLVTGSAGFIGFHLVRRLLGEGHAVVGIDNINDYYDRSLKLARLKECGIHVPAGNEPGQGNELSVFEAGRAPSGGNYTFIHGDIGDRSCVETLFSRFQIRRIVNLAAQAGVRYSTVNPHAYLDSNLSGFLNIVEAARLAQVEHLVFASTSSVYGLNEQLPFSPHDSVAHPVSLYAASKKANEAIAHSYAHLFKVPVTGLRFFTVYGPWGRPDMALFLFTERILQGKAIDVYNDGHMKRDFTYVDDIVEGIVRVLASPAQPSAKWDAQRPDPAISSAPYRIYNIGRGRSVALMDYIAAIESETGRTARLKFLPMQPGDVKATWADVGDLEKDFGYKPSVDVADGVARFISWYRDYYDVH